MPLPERPGLGLAIEEDLVEDEAIIDWEDTEETTALVTKTDCVLLGGCVTNERNLYLVRVGP